MHLPEPIFKDSIAYLIKHKSIEELKQNELKHWYSDNVIIFAELLKYQNYEPSFKDPFFQDFYNELKNEGYTPERTIDIISYFIKTFVEMNTDKKEFQDPDVLKNFMKLYPVILDSIGKFWINIDRTNSIKKAYNFTLYEDTIDNILWAHDSYFNHFYGYLTHLDAISILEEALRKEKDYEQKIRIVICLAYRYIENNNFQKMRRMLKKYKKFLGLKLYRNNVKIYTDEASVRTSFILKRVYALSKTISDYRRTHMNINMLLYKSETNKNKKYKFIKQILKRNNIPRAIIMNYISRILMLDDRHQLQPFRPQHIGRIIETYVDKYRIDGDKSNDEEIQFLFVQMINTIFINEYYPGDLFLKVQVTSELFFFIYQYLRNFHNITIFD